MENYHSARNKIKVFGNFSVHLHQTHELGHHHNEYVLVQDAISQAQ
jgi:hypothetical protein